MSAEQKRHSDVFVNQNPNAGSDAAPPLLVAILDEFASDRRPLLVYPYEIVARTGANKGAVYRAFKQGVESGWLVRSAHAATDAYRLGPKAVRLLQHWIDQSLYEADRCGAVVQVRRRGGRPSSTGAPGSAGRCR